MSSVHFARKVCIVFLVTTVGSFAISIHSTSVLATTAPKGSTQCQSARYKQSKFGANCNDKCEATKAAGCTGYSLTIVDGACVGSADTSCEMNSTQSDGTEYVVARWCQEGEGDSCDCVGVVTGSNNKKYTDCRTYT